ncbi:ribbon-helix-helix protein, CopG family [Rhizobium straminoryzae]|uniref:Ribbon-helix-helix protein, CopG family n=1 Tax=Rhizobium straminoryzae TaxID=1387186 RepID=A0A549T241_9HYPH|nr:ribbon-helix-helix protein, CopG family [Rhizobium straminoryzae]TRL35938.1 ribbon-helix-helix protein, CopG family [Rhizobium straminoryzae]
MSIKETVSIDGDLKKRLAVIAEREGSTVSELAESVLRHHAEDVERQEAEFAEDDRRWAKYLETGECISFEDMIVELQSLADEAGRKAAGAA